MEDEYMDKLKQILNETRGPKGYELLSAERSEDSTVVLIKYGHKSILNIEMKDGQTELAPPSEKAEVQDYLDSLAPEEDEEPAPKRKKRAKKRKRKPAPEEDEDDEELYDAEDYT